MFIGVTVHETHESFPVVVILNFKATNDAPELVSFFATKDNATTGGVTAMSPSSSISRTMPLEPAVKLWKRSRALSWAKVIETDLTPVLGLRCRLTLLSSSLMPLKNSIRGVGSFGGGGAAGSVCLFLKKLNMILEGDRQ